MRRPKSFGVGDIRVRAVKGPRDDEWYWRAERYVENTTESIWAGWATRAEVTRLIAEHVATEGLGAPVTPSRLETVFDLLDVWVGSIDGRVDLAKRTTEIYRAAAGHLARVLGQYKVERVGAGDLEEYRDRRLREGAATSTVALELRVFQIAWRWGSRVGVCPARDLPAPRINITRVQNDYTPTPTEAALVLEQLDGWPGLLFLMLATTGCRIGELLNLRWDALNLDRREVTVTGKGKTRIVPLRDEVVHALEAWPPQPLGRVFGVQPTTIRVGFRKKINEACRATGVPRFTPHGLRRMVENTLAESGIDPATYAALLGHSELVALKHYRRVRPNALRAAVAVQGLALPTTSPGTMDPVMIHTRKH